MCISCGDVVFCSSPGLSISCCRSDLLELMLADILVSTREREGEKEREGGGQERERELGRDREKGRKNGEESEGGGPGKTEREKAREKDRWTGRQTESGQRDERQTGKGSCSPHPPHSYGRSHRHQAALISPCHFTDSLLCA